MYSSVQPKQKRSVVSKRRRLYNVRFRQVTQLKTYLDRTAIFQPSSSFQWCISYVKIANELQRSSCQPLFFFLEKLFEVIFRICSSNSNISACLTDENRIREGLGNCQYT